MFRNLFLAVALVGVMSAPAQAAELSDLPGRAVNVVKAMVMLPVHVAMEAVKCGTEAFKAGVKEIQNAVSGAEEEVDASGDASL